MRCYAVTKCVLKSHNGVVTKALALVICKITLLTLNGKQPKPCTPNKRQLKIHPFNFIVRIISISPERAEPTFPPRREEVV